MLHGVWVFIRRMLQNLTVLSVIVLTASCTNQSLNIKYLSDISDLKVVTVVPQGTGELFVGDFLNRGNTGISPAAVLPLAGNFIAGALLGAMAGAMHGEPSNRQFSRVVTNSRKLTEATKMRLLGAVTDYDFKKLSDSILAGTSIAIPSHTLSFDKVVSKFETETRYKTQWFMTESGLLLLTVRFYITPDFRVIEVVGQSELYLKQHDLDRPPVYRNNYLYVSTPLTHDDLEENARYWANNSGAALEQTLAEGVDTLLQLVQIDLTRNLVQPMQKHVQQAQQAQAISTDSDARHAMRYDLGFSRPIDIKGEIVHSDAQRLVVRTEMGALYSLDVAAQRGRIVYPDRLGSVD